MRGFPLAETPALVLFDCDGVLVDSEPIANPVFAAHLAASGIEMSVDEVIRRFIGRSLRDCVTMLNEEFNREFGDQWIRELRQKTDDAFRAGLTAIPNAKDAVVAVAEAGISYCVASSGAIDKMNLTLGMTGLLKWFEGRMFSGWEVERGKPFPDLFLAAAKAMNALPADCIVIEDSEAGVQAGTSAGMQVLAYVPDGAFGKFSKLGATPFSDMAEVSALLGIQVP